MFDWLKGFLAQLVCWIKTALVEVANAVWAALMAAAGAVISHLPNFPDLDGWEAFTGDVVSFANWFVPITFFAQWLAGLGVLVLVWFAIGTALRWAKVIG